VRAGRLKDVIVVGIDGSESSQEALAWALAEARSRDGQVRVVAAWHVESMVYAAAPFVPPVEGGIGQSFERVAQSAIAESLEAAGDATEGIDIERSIVEGAAARVLIQEAENAELLVVGSRGRGGFAALLLGSVSEQCARHAACPVVIVRHRDS
jgi:nucleotide-binding universal stress UspA family protein